VPDEVASRIRRSHPELKRKIRAAIDDILQNPSSGKPLRDELAGLRSFRVGKIRIVYREASQSIELVTIGPRTAVYGETLRLTRRERDR
jgi:mRNA interferase RelE/StbE